MVNSVVERIRNKIINLENERDELEKQVELLQNNDSDELNQLNNEKQKMEMEIDSIKRDLKFKDESLNDTINQLEDAINEKDNTIKEKEGLVKSIELLQKSIKDLNNKIVVKDIQLRKYEGNSSVKVPTITPIKPESKLLVQDDVSNKIQTEIIKPVVTQPTGRGGMYYSMRF